MNAFRVKSIALVLLAASLGLTSPVQAALTDKDVEKLIRDEKTWMNRTGLTVQVNQTELTIGTYRQPSATDKDLKIDTILIARKLMDADPDIARVKVRFYDPVNRHSYHLIDVRQSDIKAFGTGLVTSDVLLSGIDIHKVVETSNVTEGPYGAERLHAKQHIDKLRSEGVGVAAFVQLFGQAEDLAQTISKETNAEDAARHKAELRTTLDRLAHAFDQHAAFLRQKKDREAAKQSSALEQSRAQQQQAASARKQVAASQPPPAETDASTGIENLGVFNPMPGPFLIDRIYIARKLAGSKNSGVPVSHLVPIWKRMESAVRQRDESTLKSDMAYLQKQLGLEALTDDQRRNTSVIRTKPF